MEDIVKVVNLTPHPLNEVNTGNTIPPSGVVARLKTSREQVGEVGGYPLYKTSYGKLEDLPAPEAGVVFVVSALAKMGTTRDDVVCPGNLRRDENGVIIGCDGFNV